MGENKAGVFFGATLVMWGVSVFFEILFNGRSELAAVVAGFGFYQSANWAVRSWISRDPLLVNTSVSLLHSSITSVSVIFILVNQLIKNGWSDIFEHSQLFGGTWVWAYQALCFSCGYFAYDQWDMLRYRLYSGWIPSILVHHLLLLVCFTLALYRNVTINYLILTLICELHSIFLHVRKIRRMAGVRDVKSKIVKVEWVFNWVTFLVARSISHILITIKLIQDSSKFGKGVELPFALFGMAGAAAVDHFRRTLTEEPVNHNTDIPRIISQNQGGFVSGRAIRENLALTQEVTRNLGCKAGGGNVIFKRDTDKAFDRVN